MSADALVPRWRATLFQWLFGTMAVALGGFISAEPTLHLERLANGRLECNYALNAYGRISALRATVTDLARYEVSSAIARGPRGQSSGAGSLSETHTLVLVGREGDRMSVGQAFDLLALDRMLEGRSESPIHWERIRAGRARRYGGWALGAFGLLLLSGALWNLVLMLTGQGRALEAVPGG
jgi:hypothetical protein